ncbi:glycosyltransferase family 2 protein [Clostridium grantii]|uniref:Glycosyl transferase family 2 n=1 Tax=Clostridium grantii DSM 8605 TaxID=1121316 RepID=A0A1M5Y904_9CLOT|nr:glycosyltransferase family 2 protein [Clostridium grantii]SHI08436.1 Glycosyl transferase family 2 [Clostridium grantii DSM 8605]
MAKVSIVIPIYNAEKTLDKCIKSIINQSFRDLELILINDGSNDNSLKICEKYSNKDVRIVVINKKNEGCIAARMEGVQASTAEYVMFVDADDWVNREIVEILYKESIENCTDITVCNMYKVLGNRALIKRKNKSMYFSKDKIYRGEEIKTILAAAYLHGHPFPASLFGKLYKRELLIKNGKYLPRIKFLGEDLFYNLEIFLKVDKVKIIDKPLYYYRVGGFTSKYMPYIFDDATNGYEIQKEVIEEHYLDTMNKRLNGISIMLLNTFKTCLFNCFKCDFNKNSIKEMIGTYVKDKSIIEASYNEGAINYFEKEYLNAIRKENLDYLYELGEKIYRRNKPRKILLNILSKIAI